MPEKGQVLPLRPHHGLCILSFEGHGYDEDFTAHMQEVVQGLRGDSETEVRLTKGCDDLCAHCPNRKGDDCSSKKPPVFDEKVLEKAGLSYGQVLTWGELSQKTKVLFRESLQQICGTCEWYPICDRKREEVTAQKP